MFNVQIHYDFDNFCISVACNSDAEIMLFSDMQSKKLGKLSERNRYGIMHVRLVELQHTEKHLREILEQTIGQLLQARALNEQLSKEKSSLVTSNVKLKASLNAMQDQVEVIQANLYDAEHRIEKLQFFPSEFERQDASHPFVTGKPCDSSLLPEAGLFHLETCSQDHRSSTTSNRLKLCLEEAEHQSEQDESVTYLKLIKLTSLKSNHGLLEDSQDANNILCSNDQAFIIHNEGHWRCMTNDKEYGLLGHLLRKVKALKTKLVASELQVVELKVEIEDMQAKIQRCECFDVERGSTSGDSVLCLPDFKALQDRCMQYEEEIRLLLEQVPTPEDDLQKEMYYLKSSLGQNSLLQASVTKRSQVPARSIGSTVAAKNCSRGSRRQQHSIPKEASGNSVTRPIDSIQLTGKGLLESRVSAHAVSSRLALKDINANKIGVSSFSRNVRFIKARLQTSCSPNKENL